MGKLHSETGEPLTSNGVSDERTVGSRESRRALSTCSAHRGTYVAGSPGWLGMRNWQDGLHLGDPHL